MILDWKTCHCFITERMIHLETVAKSFPEAHTCISSARNTFFWGMFKRSLDLTTITWKENNTLHKKM